MAEMPKDGFLKVVAPKQVSVSPSDKAKLIRAANKFYNQGDILSSKKIVLAIGYTSGIIRLGDYYYKQGDVFEAYRMYAVAPCPEKVLQITEDMAMIIQQWINE